MHLKMCFFLTSIHLRLLRRLHEVFYVDQNNIISTTFLLEKRKMFIHIWVGNLFFF
jgi:hypothetical protein